MFDLVISLLSLTTYFGLGWEFYRYGLFQDYGREAIESRKAKMSRILYSLTLTIAGAMFQLIIFEVLDVMQASSRQLAWKIYLSMMCLLVLVVLPFTLCFLVLRSISLSSKVCCVISFIHGNIFLLGMWKVGEKMPVNCENENETYHRLLDSAIASIAVIGVATIAILSGFGAVYMPYESFTLLWKPTDLSTIAVREKSYVSLLIMIAEKKRKILSTRHSFKSHEHYLNVSEGKSMISKVLSVATGMELLKKNKGSHSFKTPEQIEVEALEELSHEIFLEINEMRKTLESSMKSQTLVGRVKIKFGYFMTSFCVFKMVRSAYNVAKKKTPQRDGITTLIEILLQKFQLDFDVAFWTQCISFFLLGILMFMQTRGFLLNMMKISRASLRTIQPHILAIVLSQLTGMYFLSSVVLMRMNMPAKYRMVISEVFGEIEFSFYHVWFDTIFFLSSLATAAFALFSYTMKKNLHNTLDEDLNVHNAQQGYGLHHHLS